MASTETVVLHDGSIHPGGGVAVALEAARALDADLVVGFSGVDREWWAERAPNDVDVLTKRKRKWFVKDLQVTWKLLHLDLSAYDVVLSSGPAAKFYQAYDDQRVVHYTHHPPLSSLWYEGGLFRYVLKTLDRIETWSVPTLLANSALTADRIEAQYARDATVVHPPVDVERFAPDRERTPDEVVMVGRLEERKRPAVAVDAFRLLAERRADGEGPVPQLHLLGDGPQRSSLASDAPANVHVHGFVDDADLVDRVERAAAGLFLARREDFGITPVEYMAAGAPVVGVDEPNTNDQVVDGETGVLVAPEPEAVADGVERALATDWDRAAIRARAEEYGTERFHEAIRREVLT